jgi:hypothetical protein
LHAGLLLGSGNAFFFIGLAFDKAACTPTPQVEDWDTEAANAEYRQLAEAAARQMEADEAALAAAIAEEERLAAAAAEAAAQQVCVCFVCASVSYKCGCGCGYVFWCASVCWCVVT